MEPSRFEITLKLFMLRSCPTGGEQLLVLRDRKSQLGDLPGGRLGRGEIFQPWQQPLGREIEEELGSSIELSIEPRPLFFFAHRMIASRIEALGVAYLAWHKGGSIALSDEHDWSAWVDVADYAPEPLYCDHMAVAVKRFLHFRRSIPTLGYEKSLNHLQSQTTLEACPDRGD